ncbi:unnamed protein product, partial [Urochloa humidicola]
KLRAAGLLPIARLVEGDMLDAELRLGEKATCFHFDMSLLGALLDRWRPETHTFHLPVGEMALTLQDVALLLGLPCAGQAVAADDVPADWRDDLLARFAGVQCNACAAPYRTFTSTHGPTKKWLMQFSADFHIPTTVCVPWFLFCNTFTCSVRWHFRYTSTHVLCCTYSWSF